MARRRSTRGKTPNKVDTVLTDKKVETSPPQKTDSNNVTIDLTNDSIVEIIDLDNEPDEPEKKDDAQDDEVIVLGFQVNPKPKTKLDVVPIENKPIEDISFKSPQTSVDPFTFGRLKKGVERLSLTKATSPGKRKSTSPKKVNNSVARKPRVSSGQAKKNITNNFARTPKKAANTRKTRQSANEDIASLKFTVNSFGKKGFKNKKPKANARSTTKYNRQQNVRQNINSVYGFPQRNPFVFTSSNEPGKVLSSLGGPENSRRNLTSGDSKMGNRNKVPEEQQTWSTYGLNAYVSPSGEKDDRSPGTPRPIFIDGSNVAMGHGKNCFSCTGIKLCIEYFLTRGHTKVKAFVPKFRTKSSESRDPHILDDLEKKGLVVFTPSREVGRLRIASYDDRYIVQCAAMAGAIIVSNDNYRDLYDEQESWRPTITERILPFTWIDQDWIMFPADPLGRRGPPLDQFLLF